jgi:hypothetical protein
MGRRSPGLVAGCFWLVAGSACEPAIDLSTSLNLIPTLTGYYDNGLNANKLNHYLPSITFQLKNEGDMPLSTWMSIAFWRGRTASRFKYPRYRSTALAPAPRLRRSRASVGCTSLRRADFLEFRTDVVVMFCKTTGKTTKLASFPLSNGCCVSLGVLRAAAREHAAQPRDRVEE